MKNMICVLVTILFISCDQPPNYIDGETRENAPIRYFKDSRTGLCYSERGKDSDYSYTCVPCTEDVLELIDSRNTKK